MQGSPVQFSLEDLSPVEKRLTVEVAREQVSSKLDEAYRKLSREVNLKGFRKGKAPRPLLEQLFARRVESDVAQELVTQSMMQFAQQSDLRMVTNPTLEGAPPEPRRNQPMRFSARIEIWPVVVPKDYDGLEVTRRALKVEDADIDAELQKMRRGQVELVPIQDRETATGTDTLTVLLTGEIGSKINWKEKEMQIDLGDPRDEHLPGLGQALIGLPLHAVDHEIHFTLPDKGLSADFQGKAVTFKVTVKAAHERRLPELDDEFAKDTGEATTLAELRDRIRTRLLDEDKEKASEELRMQLVDEVLRRNPVMLPPSPVQRYTEQFTEEVYHKNVVKAMGPGAKDAEGASAVSVESARAEARTEVTRQLSVELIMTSIADREKIEVTEAELEKHLAEIASSRDKSVARIKAELQKEDPQLQGQRSRIRLEKTLDLLESRAKISEAKEEAP